MVFVEKYLKDFKERKLEFPSGNNPMDKADPYSPQYLQWAQYIYGQYCIGNSHMAPYDVSLLNGGNYGNSSAPRSMRELRQYARSMQPTEKYSTEHKNNNTKDPTKLEALAKISQSNTRLFEKLREHAIDQVMKMGLEPNCIALDSVQRREKYERYFRDRLAADARMKQVMAQAQVAPDGVSSIAMEGAIEDIEALHQLGGYAAAGEILLTDAISTVLKLCSYDDVIRRMISEDYFDLNRCFLRVSMDKATRNMRVHYCDPERVIVPNSIYPDLRDITYAAEMVDMTINQLQIEYDLDNDTLDEISKVYANSYGNETIYSAMSGRSTYTASRAEIGGEKRVCVLTGYFVSRDIETFVDGYHPRTGSRVFDKVKPTSKLSKKDMDAGKQLKNVSLQYVYKFNWVIGTNIIFGCGKDDSIVRDGALGSKIARIPMFGYIGNGDSIVARCIPTIDEIEVAVRKKRLLIASLPPGPRIAIDIKKIASSIQLGTKNYDILELLSLFSSRGVFLYSSIGEWDAQGQGGSMTKGIEQLNVSIAEDLNLFMSEISTNIAFLKEQTGISDILSGQATAARVATDVAAQLKEAGTGALSQQFIAHRKVFDLTQSMIGKKFQSAVAAGEIELDSFPVHTDTVRVITLTPELFFYNFEFICTTRPTEADKQMLIEVLGAKYKEGSVDEAAYFTIIEMVRNNEMKKAQFYLSYYVKQKTRERIAETQQNIALQGQQNQQAALAAEQGKQQTKVAEWQARTQYMEKEYELRSKYGDIANSNN